MSDPTASQRKAMTIICPTCNAGVGEHCNKPRSEDGVPDNRQPVHRERYLMSIRRAT